MNITQRSVFISAAVGVLSNGLIGLLGLLVAGHLTRPRLLGPSKEELTLDLALFLALIAGQAVVCAGTGGLFAHLSRSENLPQRLTYVLGGAAGALAQLLPAAFFGAVSAVVNHLTHSSTASMFSIHTYYSWWLLALASALGGFLAMLIGGCFGAGGAAITVRLFAGRTA